MHTFFEALVLVVIVVFVFLQSLRATLIPVLAVPVSIVGTFMGMTGARLLDQHADAVRHGARDRHRGGRRDRRDRERRAEHERAQAQSEGRGQDARWTRSAGPVIAIVLVLCAVFVPVAFLSGITGQLYKQFAITIAISVVISGLVALTLSPALARLLLKPGHHEKKGFFRWFDNALRADDRTATRAWSSSSSSVSLVALLLFAGMIALSVVMMRAIPTRSCRPEDQGYLLGAVIMPDAASLDRTGDVSQHVTDYFMKQPAVSSVTVVDGYSLLDSQNKNNAATFFIGFKSFDERYKSDEYPDPERARRAARRLRRSSRR